MPSLRKRTSKGRFVVSILLGMMILFSLASTPSPKATASTCVAYLNIKYYTDATLATQCGGHWYNCDGTDWQGGCETEYTRVFTCTCEE